MNANVRIVHDGSKGIPDLGQLLDRIGGNDDAVTKPGPSRLPKASYDLPNFASRFAENEDDDAALDRVQTMIAGEDPFGEIDAMLEASLEEMTLDLEGEGQVAAVEEPQPAVDATVEAECEAQDPSSYLPPSDQADQADQVAHSSLEPGFRASDAGLYLVKPATGRVDKQEGSILYLEIGLENSILSDPGLTGAGAVPHGIQLNFGKASLLPYFAPGLDAFFSEYEIQQPRSYFFSAVELGAMLKSWTVVLYGKKIDLSIGRERALVFMKQSIAALLEHAPRPLSHYSEIRIVADSDIADLLRSCTSIAPNIIFNFTEE